MAQPQDYQFDVFVSYSGTDRNWVVEWLVPALRTSGLRVCVDLESFRPGLPSIINMERAINESRKVLLVLTPAWIGTEWGQFEALMVQNSDPSGRAQRLVPILLAPCDLPLRLKIFTFLDLTEPALRHDRLPQLLAALHDSNTGLLLPGPDLPFAGSEFTGTSSNHANPFGARGMISHQDFFGRTLLVKHILTELDKRNNVSVVGAAQVGKSSLLSMLSQNGRALMQHPPDTFVYLSLEWIDGPLDFYIALADYLKLPGPLRGIRLLKVLANRNVIVCLDDIERLGEKGFTRDFRSQLRGLVSTIYSPIRLVTGSRLPLSQIFPESTIESSLDGVCQRIDLPPFYSVGVPRLLG